MEHRGQKMISLASNGQRDEAVAFSMYFAVVGARLSNASREWIQHNEQLADGRRAGPHSVPSSNPGIDECWSPSPWPSC